MLATLRDTRRARQLREPEILVAHGTLQPMSRRSSREMPLAVPKEERDLLCRIEEALSDEEIRRVLGSALLILDDNGRKRLCARLAPETEMALSAALDSPRRHAQASKTAVVVAGKGKLRQEWDRLWQEWAEVVGETGDEHGRYVEQYAEWEPPYVVTSSIATDLDAIAKRMRSLIPRVLAKKVAPDFSFAQAIRDMDDALYAGLPDWMDATSGDPCYRGNRLPDRVGVDHLTPQGPWCRRLSRQYPRSRDATDQGRARPQHHHHLRSRAVRGGTARASRQYGAPTIVGTLVGSIHAGPRLLGGDPS
jgi:hypothetical protein